VWDLDCKFAEIGFDYCTGTTNKTNNKRNYKHVLQNTEMFS